MITVIIPVYNSATFLDKCISSVLSQSYNDFELLLINDGSTDNSGEICDHYAQKDSRVKVIHKGNGGVSSARNIGLDQAKGEWITFVDSDDWVHEDFLKKRYELAIAEDADVVYCDLELVYVGRREYCHAAEIDPKEDSQVNCWIRSKTTYSPILLIKKELLDKYHLRFLPGVRLCEDLNLIIKTILYAKKTVHVKEALYYYNKQNSESTMHNPHLYWGDLQLAFSDLIDTFKANGVYNRYKEGVSWCILEYKFFSIINKEHSFDELKDFYPESHQYIWTNDFLNFKSKVFLTLYEMKLDVIANSLLKIYHWRKTKIPNNN